MHTTFPPPLAPTPRVGELSLCAGVRDRLAHLITRLESAKAELSRVPVRNHDARREVRHG